MQKSLPKTEKKFWKCNLCFYSDNAMNTAPRQRKKNLSPLSEKTGLF